jgi:hypothetical protein
MLWTVFVVAFAVWLLALQGEYTPGGFLSLALIIGIIGVFYQLVAGRRPAS